jgi:two-component system sensor histidine kinase KdpD
LSPDQSQEGRARYFVFDSSILSIFLTNEQSLLETAREEAERLNRLVGNLLAMTRTEAGAIVVRREPCDVLDVIGTALETIKDQLSDRPVKVDIPDDLPLVPMDFVLIERVLGNEHPVMIEPD